MKTNTLGLTLLMVANSALANNAPNNPQARCDHAALQSAERYGVPTHVMLAITRVETGRDIEGTLSPWPWAVNVAGASHWFNSQSEAADFVRRELDAGTSNIDLGCFQLNWRWHGQYFPSIDDMLNPDLNAEYAAAYLVEQHRQRGNWVDAVAAYHSSNPEYAERYIEKVERILMDLSADRPNIEEKTHEMSAPIDRNDFPLLRQGETGSLASLVPAGGAARPVVLMGP